MTAPPRTRNWAIFGFLLIMGPFAVATGQAVLSHRPSPIEPAPEPPPPQIRYLAMAEPITTTIEGLRKQAVMSVAFAMDAAVPDTDHFVTAVKEPSAALIARLAEGLRLASAETEDPGRLAAQLPASLLAALEGFEGAEVVQEVLITDFMVQ